MPTNDLNDRSNTIASNQAYQASTSIDNMKHCIVCSSEVNSLKVSPQHGKHKHAEHECACDECWEAWLSLQVEENLPEEIACMFCASKQAHVTRIDPIMSERRLRSDYTGLVG